MDIMDIALRNTKVRSQVNFAPPAWQKTWNFSGLAKVLAFYIPDTNALHKKKSYCQLVFLWQTIRVVQGQKAATLDGGQVLHFPPQTSQHWQPRLLNQKWHLHWLNETWCKFSNDTPVRLIAFGLQSRASHLISDYVESRWLAWQRLKVMISALK